MRIFIDARVLNNQKISGIFEYTKNLLNHLLKIDQENEYLLFLNSFRKRRKIDFNFKNIKILNYHLPNRFLELLTRFLNFPKIDQFIKADIFFQPNINILAFKEYQKRIMTIHDLSFVHFPEFFGYRERLWHWRQNLEKQIQKIGLIIAVSDFTREDILKTFKLRPEKVIRIYSGVNKFYQPKDFPLPSRPFILYLGTIEPRKNISTLIQAFNLLKKNNKKFQDFQLVLAGSFGWLYDKILKEAQESVYFSDIIFKGQVSEEEALVLYNTASVFVYPSFFEGFGFPPLEAQACGLPVIASDQTSLPEILGKSAILVNPHRVYELTSALEAVLTNDRLRKELKVKGFENVKRFDWDKTAQEFLLCLKSFR